MPKWFNDMFRPTEIQVSTLRLRRRTRIVTYIVGEDSEGNEVEIEVADAAADAMIDAIKKAGA